MIRLEMEDVRMITWICKVRPKSRIYAVELRDIMQLNIISCSQVIYTMVWSPRKNIPKFLA